jgi:hypothetical protein
MKKNQIILKINNEEKPIKISLNKEILEGNPSFYLVNKDAKTPIRKIYAQSFWILNEGHDFSIKKTVFKSNSDIFTNKDLLIEYGEEITLLCSHCQAPVEEVFNFCGDCGKAIDWNHLLNLK